MRIDAFHELPALARQRIWDGITSRNVHGERMTLGVVELDPDAVAPEHSHPHEQFGVVLSGSVLFRIGDETKELRPGSVYVIPANAPHTAQAGPGGTVLIDVFSPVREEWQAAPAADDAEPRWPS
ncbi:MAG: cupin domain-containing protein [Actinomycetota bacterium]|nr:cupin domain-containing protein [Actinomycetota bacterium]